LEAADGDEARGGVAGDLAGGVDGVVGCDDLVVGDFDVEARGEGESEVAGVAGVEGLVLVAVFWPRDTERNLHAIRFIHLAPEFLADAAADVCASCVGCEVPP